MRFSSCDLANLEIIEAYSKPPWTPPVTVIIPEKQVAIKLASTPNSDQFIAFTDSSTRNKVVGIGVQWLGRARSWSPITRTISTPNQINPYAGELTAIEAATSYILHQIRGESQENLHSTIYSDSQEALKALMNPGQQGAQFSIRNVTKLAAEISQYASICYQWCPGHSKVPGNEEAHRLSRKATEPGSPIQLISASNVQLLASVLGTAKSVKWKQGPKKFYKSKWEDSQSPSTKHYRGLIRAYYTMDEQNCMPTSCVSCAQVSTG